MSAIDQHTLLNMLRSLHNIEGFQLPELNWGQQLDFVQAPVRYFIQAEDDQQAAIFREVAKRQPAHMEWKMIGSAPLDGTFVDLWTSLEERVTDAKWNSARKRWERWAIGGFDTMGWEAVEGIATHWMCTPPSPTPSPTSEIARLNPQEQEV